MTTELQQLDNNALDALAATKIHGWQIREETYQEDRDMYFGTGYQTTFTDWVDSSGTFQVSVRDYTPTTDRNQSGALLTKMVERGADFDAESYGVYWKVDARAETIAALAAFFAMEAGK